MGQSHSWNNWTKKVTEVSWTVTFGTREYENTYNLTEWLKIVSTSGRTLLSTHDFFNSCVLLKLLL